MSTRKTAVAVLSTLLACALQGALGGAPALARESCPNEASRQGPSLALPECRVYEQVTPVDKGDAIDLFQAGYRIGSGTYQFFPRDQSRGVAAEDGEAFMLFTNASIGPGAPTTSSLYVFSRGADGWGMTPIAPPVDQVQLVSENPVFDPSDLSMVGFSDEIGSLADAQAGDAAGFRGANYVGRVGGPYATVSSSVLSVNSGKIEEQFTSRFVGGSGDLSKAILESTDRVFAAGAAGVDEGSEEIYEYESAGGGECTLVTTNCKLAGVAADGSPFQCGASLGQGDPGHGGNYSAVSSDGSKVFFTAPEPEQYREGLPGCWGGDKKPLENPPEVYVRVDGERTVEVSKPEAGVGITAENPLQPAAFAGASADGSKVFFVTDTELTKDDTTHAEELYEYETETGKLTRVSRGESGSAEGDVDFVAAVSSDGSAVYFTAFGALAAGASALPDPAGDGFPVNLYRYDTLTGRTTYIAQVSKSGFPAAQFGEPSGNWTGTLFGGEGYTLKAENVALTPDANWYATGNGQFLVFASKTPITGFDNIKPPGVSCDAKTGEVAEDEPEKEGGFGYRCTELYRYDAASNETVCVSCAGGAPIDGALFTRADLDDSSAAPPRPISENGEDVFFDTSSALVAQAAPGKPHVYEWHDGTIYLISSPSDPSYAFFLGSSANGSNVFFSTHAQLAPSDTDQSDDIYDARVDGGFAGIAPAACTGTGCQGVPGAPPIFATPASVTFEGVGNFPAPQAAAKTVSKASKARSKPKKCGRGLVRKHGKCVRVAKKSAKGRK
jgi:hypothetical protein